MAEHTLGVILSFVRKLHLARDAQHARVWRQRELWSDPPPIGELAGGTLGLVGFGAVGRAIAERARALALRVVTVRRHPELPPDPAHEQWGSERLPELLGQADWLVLVAALTPETRGLIGRDELRRMRAGAVLVNLGRGSRPSLASAGRRCSSARSPSWPRSATRSWSRHRRRSSCRCRPRCGSRTRRAPRVRSPASWPGSRRAPTSARSCWAWTSPWC